MLFLSPAFLWFLAAASVPVIIHLINRRRHKTIQWAAMQFLLRATRESRGKKKLRHILILTCRALALAALALAAARPIASGIFGWGGGSIDTVVLVLDRSASMELSTGDGRPARRASVLAEVRKAMEALGSSRLVLIDSASGAPQEVASTDVLEDISSTAATDAAADMPALFTRAVEYVVGLEGRTEIWLASDMQSSNWQAEDDRWAAARASWTALPRPPAVRVLAANTQGSANHSLRLIGTRRSGNDLTLDVEVTRSGEARGNAALPLTVHLNGASTTENLVVPGQAFRFQKRLVLPDEESEGFGWLSLPGDGNPRDNVAFFAYGPARAVESILVADAGETADYLALAAAPPGLAGYGTKRVDPAQAAAAVRADLGAIFWAVPLPSGPVADALKKYLDQGGQVVFFAPSGNEMGSFDGMTWSVAEQAAEGKFFILKEWNRTDGPLRDGLDGTAVAGSKLKGIRRRVPDETTTAMAAWEDGQAFLSRRIYDRGTAWFVGTVPDYTWSNLGDADVLLPMVMRVLAAGSDRLDASRITEVGVGGDLVLPGEARSRLDTYGTPNPANATYEAGVYRAGGRVVASNRPTVEDDAIVIDRDQLDVVLAGTGYTFLDQAGQGADSKDSRDVWQAFLVAMLVFLLTEAWLCLPKRLPTADKPVSSVIPS
jgi:hypothetical protein